MFRYNSLLLELFTIRNEVRLCRMIPLPSLREDHCGTSFSAFSVFVIRSNDVFYSDHIFQSSNIFGCVGLRGKQYCVFNRQYDAQSYSSLVGRIVEHMEKTGEWGRFFPPTTSPFDYNETVAQEYFPLEKADAISQGWTWKDSLGILEEKVVGIEPPDSINDVDSSILKSLIKSELSGSPIRIISEELKFYKKLRLPIPRRTPHERHGLRESLRNPRILCPRYCAKCGVEVMSTFPMSMPQSLFCNDCYERQIFGAHEKGKQL